VKDIVNEVISSVVEGFTEVDTCVPHAAGVAVMLNGAWIPSDRKLWRSWTGRRAVWGLEYHGPIYAMESTNDSTPWDGPRECNCDKCQSNVKPTSRSN